MGDQDDKRQYSDSPEGWAQRWGKEFEIARRKFEKYWEKGKEIADYYVDATPVQSEGEERLALYHSNTSTMHALLYGKTPKVSVERKYSDKDDDAARDGGMMLARVLNSDLETGSDGSAEAMSHSVLDMLMHDFGMVRLRYVPTFTTVPGTEAIIDPASGKTLAPEIPEQQVVSDEEVETLYVHYQDVMWSSARVFNEITWFAFRNPMSRGDLVARFGEEVGNDVPLNSKTEFEPTTDAVTSHPWQRADVWEIWDKENRKVDWYVEGYPRVLDSKPDPLQLLNFWPFPKPLIINCSTADFFPCPDFKLHQSQYKSVNELTTRIALLTKAVKVAGIYDKTATQLQDVFKSPENTMIPVDSWAAFAETAGIKGHMEFLPLDQIVAALDKLREIRNEEIQLLFQVSGMSDIMRGQSSQQATATEQAIKARFASVRIQTMQDAIAEFASRTAAIKAEIISKKYRPQSLLEKSNFQFTMEYLANPMAAQSAIQIVKDRFPGYRIKVKPEQVALTDFAALQQERTAVVMSISQFFQSAVPVLQLMPDFMPNLLEILQWALAGFKGASEIEGVLKSAIKGALQQIQQRKMQQAQQGPPPNPEMMKLQAQQQKSQIDTQHKMLDAQISAAHTKQELQADLVRSDHETRNALIQAHAQDQLDQVAERRKGIMDLLKTLPGGNGEQA